MDTLHWAVLHGFYNGFISTDKLGEIHELISQDSTERPNYVASAIKWSIGGKDSGHKTGHPDLHRKFAVTLWHGQFSLALLSRDVRVCSG